MQAEPDTGPIAAGSLRALKRQAQDCRRCPLYLTGTQTVFGEGPARARLFIVGEVPGDKEDEIGRPFVGPAGRLLDEALRAAGIARPDAYVTNAVKHFKWVRAGKRRLHQKPNAAEIRACRPWLESELAFVKPRVVLALGATAAQALMGPQFRITRSRGQAFIAPWADVFFATYHPSAILRAPPEARAQMEQEFATDLKTVAAALAGDRFAHDLAGPFVRA